MHRRIMSKHQQFSRGHVGKQEWDMSPRHHYHQYWRVNNAAAGWERLQKSYGALSRLRELQ